MKTTFRLDGRRALVTGGASGIGEHTVRALTGAGATVTIGDLNLASANSLAAELGGRRHAEPGEVHEDEVGGGLELPVKLSDHLFFFSAIH